MSYQNLRFCVTMGLTITDAGFLDGQLAKTYLQFGLGGAAIYTATHGYTFEPVLFGGKGEHVGWNRLRMTLRLLASPECDFIAWLEGDVFITNHTVQLASFVQFADDHQAARGLPSPQIIVAA